MGIRALVGFRCLIACPVALAGCGDAGVVASCTLKGPSGTTCTDNRVSTDAVEAVRTTCACMVVHDGGECSGTAGTFAEQPCDRTGVEARCTLAAGATTYFYAGYPLDVATADCSRQGGTFLEP